MSELADIGLRRLPELWARYGGKLQLVRPLFQKRGLKASLQTAQPK